MGIEKKNGKKGQSIIVKCRDGLHSTQRKVMNKNFAKRIVIYFIGLFIMTVGIAVSVKSDLGVSPVSSIPYSITCIWGMEMGRATIIFHCALVLLQVILLRRQFKIINLTQVLVGIVFGYFTTLCNWLVSFLPSIHNLVIRFVLMLLSTFFIAFGIFMYMPANIMPLAGEGAMKAVSDVTKIDFPKVKVGFDVSMVVISLISCLIFIRGLGSVGIGTIIAAVLVGVILGFITKILGKKRDQWLGSSQKENNNKEKARSLEEGIQLKDGEGNDNHKHNHSNNHYVITIAREYGSGGREIGHDIAKQLGISYYDLDVISKVSQDIGVPETIVEENEQSIKNVTDSYLLNWCVQSTSEEQLPIVERIFHSQTRIIRDIASKESCVIVGRLANHILKEGYQCFNVFIGADMESKVQQIMERDGLTEEEAKAKIEKVEKERENHCIYFTRTEWRNLSNYDFYIKSDILGFEKTAKVIIKAAKKKLKF